MGNESKCKTPNVRVLAIQPTEPREMEILRSYMAMGWLVARDSHALLWMLVAGHLCTTLPSVVTTLMCNLVAKAKSPVTCCL